MERPESSDTVVEIDEGHDTVSLMESHSQDCGETEQVLVRTGEGGHLIACTGYRCIPVERPHSYECSQSSVSLA